MHPVYVALHKVTWRGYMVDTKHASTAAVSCGTSHVTTRQRSKYTTSVDIQNALWKATLVKDCDLSAASPFESGE